MIVDIRDLIPGIRPSFTDYWTTEQEVLSPALREAGYALHCNWYTSEGDSFGPLSRAIQASKDGVEFEIFYG